MTPTCRSCQTKFPGKDVCKACGADPNAEPTLAHKIERELAKKVKVVAEVTTVKTRASQRARLRSLRATTTSGRRIKHGRVGVR